MLKKILSVFIVIGVLVWSPTAQANDWALWSNFNISGKLNAHWNWKVAPQFRFDNNFSNHHYTHVEMGLSYKAAPWLGIAPAYRHVLTEGGADWKTEKRPQLDLNLSHKMWELNRSDRNRFEFRFRDSGESIRYRNKLTVKFPRLSAGQLQPYLANEIFYDMETDVLNKK